eukprot:Seg4322.2 transcript_id=Seg4322.2/GoldUCD/mRNA.D3Y31 product="Leptin receptor overlapping transcript-like 1" protein_id=Seg4322.2/GoldUCD/D3Y31
MQVLIFVFSFMWAGLSNFTTQFLNRQLRELRFYASGNISLKSQRLKTKKRPKNLCTALQPSSNSEQSPSSHRSRTKEQPVYYYLIAVLSFVVVIISQMGIVAAILCMSLAAAVGILMLVFACGYNKFHTTKGASWVLFVVFFYIVVPVPAVIVHRLKRLRTAFVKDANLNSWAKKNKDTVIKTEIVADFLLFFTSGIIISSFAFPVVLARAQVVSIIILH